MPTNTVCCESDGLEYLSNPVQLKCKKCGHFWFAKDPVPTCHASPSTMMKVVLDRTEKPPSIIDEFDFKALGIEKETDIGYIKSFITRVYEAGFKHGAKHEGSYEVAFKAGRGAALEEVRKIQEDMESGELRDLFEALFPKDQEAIDGERPSLSHRSEALAYQAHVFLALSKLIAAIKP